MNKSLERRIEELEKKETESDVEIPIQLRMILNVIAFVIGFFIVRLISFIFRF